MIMRTLSVLLVLVFSNVAAQLMGPGPLPESSSSPIGYKTVKEALEALKAKPGVKVWVQNGWTVIEDQTGKNPSLWSFSPPDYPAYPAAVKRTAIEQDGRTVMDMQILCQTTKQPCDALVREFDQMNARMKQDLSAK